eukprot:946853_1
MAPQNKIGRKLDAHMLYSYNPWNHHVRRERNSRGNKHQQLWTFTRDKLQSQAIATILRKSHKSAGPYLIKNIQNVCLFLHCDDPCTHFVFKFTNKEPYLIKNI